MNRILSQNASVALHNKLHSYSPSWVLHGAATYIGVTDITK